MNDTLRTTPDRDLEDAIFWIDVRRGEHLEMDCGDGEGVCDSCAADGVHAREIRAEIDWRIENSYRVEDPNAETLEQRLAPYGTEWQLEQRERVEG